METMTAVCTRRNVRQFKPDPISNDQLMKWLEAASYAPNHRRVEPWEVRVVGPETRAKLNHRGNFGDAPLVLLFLSKTSDVALDRDENLIAVSCFVQNFSLVAWEDGVGTRWTSIASKEGNRELLGISDEYDIVGILAVGHPLEVPPTKERTPMTEKISYLP